MNHDLRWVQRFRNYKKALARLNENIDYIKDFHDDFDFSNDEVYDDIVLVAADILK